MGHNTELPRKGYTVIGAVLYCIGDIMTSAACGVGNAYPSRAPDFTSGFHRGSCFLSFVFPYFML